MSSFARNQSVRTGRCGGGEVGGEELGLVNYHGLCGGCEVVSPGSIVFNVLYNERVARKKGGLFCEAR